LEEHGAEAGLRMLAYCLMPNHVHLVVVPERMDSLGVVFRRVHGRYAQYLNVRRGRSGHLWQNRFFSCALDGNHLSVALRYVERNPVRAGLVAEAESYTWSSARAHLTGKRNALLDWQFWEDWVAARTGPGCWLNMKSWIWCECCSDAPIVAGLLAVVIGTIASRRN
jgi:putative transposase